jgi:hypothetical protein
MKALLLYLLVLIFGVTVSIFPMTVPAIGGW